MSKYEEFVEHINGMSKLVVDSFRKFAEDIQEEKFAILNTMERDLERYKQTGVLKSAFGIETSDEETTEELPEPKQRGRRKKETSSSGHSSKENLGEAHPERRRATGQRKALLEASQLINTNNTANSFKQTVVVKIEELSAEFIKKHSEIADIPIKELKNNMPPPTEPPARQTRNRKGPRTADAPNSDTESVQVKVELINTASKKRKANAALINSEGSSTNPRDSDVLLTSQSVDVISLVDTDEEDTERAPQARGRGRPRTKRKHECEVSASTRATRTKTRNALKDKEAESACCLELTPESTLSNKQQRGSSTEDSDREKKAAKRTKKLVTNKKDVNTSVYEDALSEAENLNDKIVKTTEAGSEQAIKSNEAVEPQPSRVMNETVVLCKFPALNATVVVEKPKNPVLMNATVVISKIMPNGNQQLVDDLMTDDEDTVVSPEGAQKPKKVNQVFSPYAESPVRQRVEAFEKLGAAANHEMPPKMTRIKTKAKEQTEKWKGHSENEVARENIPNSAKHSSIPKLQSTPISGLRTPLHSVVRGAVSKQKVSQPAQSSGLKASQAEYRERELRRQQKEAEALSKKEALIQAQTEERRRKREERQVRAQQAREALEKEKQKQREEFVHKQALRKAAEEKLKEEEMKRLEDKRKRAEEIMYKNNRAMKIPPYLKYEQAPLLPTGDCYDSDDANAKPFSTPRWQRKEVVRRTLNSMSFIKGQIQQLFAEGPITVDLQQVFPTIEPSKLKRTSSAIWNKSGLSKLPSLAEEDNS